jgi:hypothetical protein
MKGIRFFDVLLVLASVSSLGSAQAPSLDSGTFAVTAAHGGSAITVTLTASPTTVSSGQPSTITWKTTGATDVRYMNTSTTCPASTEAIPTLSNSTQLDGNIVVRPTATVTYCLVALNAAGATATATVKIAVGGTVTPPPPPTLQSQTISFANPGAQVVGTPLTLSATASSGLTVSFASTTTTICTVSGTTVTFLTQGTCTIQATQAGNSTYSAATPVSESFAVTTPVVNPPPPPVSPGAYAVGYSTCPAPAGSGKQYTIGLTGSSTQTIAAFGDGWNNLNPGDVVCIYGKSTPYAERLILTESGTAAAPIRIVGVNQGGYDPILTGKNATTASAFNYGATISEYYAGGEISVTGLTYGYPVSYLNIEGLTIEGATTAEVGGTVADPTFSGNSYSDPNLGTTTWGCGAAGIYLIRDTNISIIHNRIKDNDNGIFVSSNNGNTSSSVLVAYNHIYGNGLYDESVNSCPLDAHGTYTEADGITYLGNRFGPNKQQQGTDLLKDRSAGLVVEYNFFEPSGTLENALGDALLVGSSPEGFGHELDLVESYDPSVGFNALGAVYTNVSVFGNIFFDNGQSSVNGSEGTTVPVHFGGDQGNPAVYRTKLHFYNNTVVTERADGVGWFEMETTTNSETWNNIFYAAGSGTFALLNSFCYGTQYGTGCGTLTYQTENWNSPIWGTTGVNGATDTNPNFVDVGADNVAIAVNDPTIVGNGQTGDSAYPANSTTIPIQYQDFLTTVARPYSQPKIDLGALGYSAATAAK